MGVQSQVVTDQTHVVTGGRRPIRSCQNLSTGRPVAQRLPTTRRVVAHSMASGGRPTGQWSHWESLLQSRHLSAGDRQLLSAAHSRSDTTITQPSTDILLFMKCWSF